MNDNPTALLTAQGGELLSRLASEGPGQDGASLALAVRLRRDYPASLVATAMAQRELRLAAEAKFSRAADMLFTRAGYEQSSSETIASYRASRLGNATRVADLCCGIGGDLVALAAAGDVLAVDRDETHARLALHNAAVYGRAEHVTAVVADVRDVRLAGTDAVFIDPARRSGPGTASAGPVSSGRVSSGPVSSGRVSSGSVSSGSVSAGPGSARTGSAGPGRRFRAGTSEPPLNWCVALTGQVEAVCIKAAPGIPEELIPPAWEAEFIAEGRDLKEAVLWSPSLATAPSAGPPGNVRGPRRATVLAAAPGGHPIPYTLVAHAGAPVPLRQPGEYLLDPNPAVTRAGLVEDLARDLGDDAAKIDPQIAFLTLDRIVRTPFARTLLVRYSAPWNEKQFAKRLRELDVGAADIRRRGLAGDVDQIRRRLKLAGKVRATVVITRVNDKPWGLICTDPDGPALE